MQHLHSIQHNDIPSRRCFGIDHLPHVAVLQMSSAIEWHSLEVLSVAQAGDLPDITCDKKLVSELGVIVLDCK